VNICGQRCVLLLRLFVLEEVLIVRLLLGGGADGIRLFLDAAGDIELQRRLLLFERPLPLAQVKLSLLGLLEFPLQLGEPPFVATDLCHSEWPDGPLPVQDRFGGLAGYSRGGPMGVRLTRVVNGDSGNRVFRAASGVQILPPRPLASRGDLRAVPSG